MNKTPIGKRHLLMVAFSVLSLAVLGWDMPQAQVTVLPSRSQLWSNFLEQRRLIVLSQEPELMTAAVVSNLLKGRRFRNWKIEYSTFGELDKAQLQASPVLLIGRPGEGERVRELVKGIPLFQQEGEFRFRERPFRELGQGVMVMAPNPLNLELPLFWITGNSEASMLDDPADLRLGEFDYLVWNGTEKLLMGFLNWDDGRHLWTGRVPTWSFLDPQTAQTTSGELKFFIYGKGLTSAQLDRVRRGRLELHEHLRSFFGSSSKFDHIEYHLYPDLESKALRTGDMSLAHRRDPNQVHAVVGDGLLGDGTGVEVDFYLPRLRRLEPILLRGLQVYFGSQWGRKGFDYWASRIYRAGLAPPLTELLKGSFLKAESSFLVEPLAGALVAFLIESLGEKVFVGELLNPGGVLFSNRESQWQAFLDRLTQIHGEKILQDRAQFPRATNFQKGVNFTHEGYRIYNGYGSRMAEKSLKRVRALGANAVAVVPYGFLESLNKPGAVQGSSRRTRGENDAAVIHTILSARALGLSTLLKPQIWFREGWPGALEMSSQRDWDLFFDHYERWIRHYALLAEIYQVPLFSLGVELSRATLLQQEAWKRLAQSIRDLYSGSLVYSANWGEEFETLSFWGEFDFIGVDNYYPLSDKRSLDLPAMQAGAKRIMSRLESVHRRFKKPVLITELGFPSLEAPWREPHRGGPGRDPNPEHQARSYEVLLEAVAGKEWCQGLYWWKWPSFLMDENELGTGFSPQGKPAESVLARWYRGRDLY